MTTVFRCLASLTHNHLYVCLQKCDLIKIVSATVKAGTWLSVMQPLDCKQDYNRVSLLCGRRKLNSATRRHSRRNLGEPYTVYHLHTQEDQDFKNKWKVRHRSVPVGNKWERWGGGTMPVEEKLIRKETTDGFWFLFPQRHGELPSSVIVLRLANLNCAFSISCHTRGTSCRRKFIPG